MSNISTYVDNLLKATTHDRYGYFTKTRGYSKPENSPKLGIEYLLGTTKKIGIGFGLVADKKFRCLCIDLDCKHVKDETPEAYDGKKKDLERKLADLKKCLDTDNIKYGIEHTEANDGLHVWISSTEDYETTALPEEVISEALALKTKGFEIFPQIDISKGRDKNYTDAHGTSTYFIRVPGIHKDGVSRSYYYSQAGDKVVFDKPEVLDTFFKMTENKELIGDLYKKVVKFGGLILGVIPSPMVKEVKKTTVAKKSGKGKSKAMFVSPQALQWLYDEVESNELYTFRSAERYVWDFSFTEFAVEYNQGIENRTKAQQAIMAGIYSALNRVDSSDGNNSFVFADFWDSEKTIIKSLNFGRNRDHKCFAVIDSVRDWNTNRFELMLKHLVSAPEYASTLGFMQDCFFTEKVYDKTEGWVTKLFSTYCFATKQPTKDGEYVEVTSDTLDAIVRIFNAQFADITRGISFSLGTNTFSRSLEKGIKADLAKRRPPRFGAGPFTRIVDKVEAMVKNGADLEDIANKAISSVIRVCSLNLEENSYESGEKALKRVLQIAAMRSLIHLRDTHIGKKEGEFVRQALAEKITNKYVREAYLSKEEPPKLTHVAAFIGEKGSGKTVLAEALCNCVLSVLDIDKLTYRYKGFTPKKGLSRGLEAEDLNYLYCSICTNLEEFKPGPDAVNQIVSYLTCNGNDTRAPWNLQTYSDNNLSILCTMTSDAKQAIPAKDGARRRFLTLKFKTLDASKKNTNEKAVAQMLLEPLKLAFETYIYRVIVQKETFENDQKENLELLFGEATKNMEKTDDIYMSALSDLVGVHTRGSEYKAIYGGASTNEAYKGRPYIICVGETLLQIYKQYTTWKNPNSNRKYSPDDSDFRAFADAPAVKKLEKVNVKLPGGGNEVVKRYKILFVNSEAVLDETEETAEKVPVEVR